MNSADAASHVTNPRHTVDGLFDRTPVCLPVSSLQPCDASWTSQAPPPDCIPGPYQQYPSSEAYGFSTATPSNPHLIPSFPPFSPSSLSSNDAVCTPPQFLEPGSHLASPYAHPSLETYFHRTTSNSPSTPEAIGEQAGATFSCRITNPTTASSPQPRLPIVSSPSFPSDFQEKGVLVPIQAHGTQGGPHSELARELALHHGVPPAAADGLPERQSNRKKRGRMDEGVRKAIHETRRVGACIRCHIQRAKVRSDINLLLSSAWLFFASFYRGNRVSYHRWQS